MDWIQGFTRCWWPGPHCVIWWDAWAALGAWFAAFATFVAVAVALYVGIAPHRATRTDHLRRARAIGMVVYGRLLRQHMHLEAARRLCAEPVDDHLFRLVRENLVADPRCADALIPYFDALDDEVASAVAAAIADLEHVTPMLRRVDNRLQAAALGRTLAPLTASLARAREHLAPIAIGHPAEDVEIGVQNLVDGANRVAASAREMRGGL